ncbi:MAG TPA: insulinase family protein, partial [Cyclobacteriaceae bacterium]|nr:insulinase family protein [Cyclobacteriaceae bacterium]
PFSDTGLFMISFGTEPTQMGKSLQLIGEELRKLKESPLGVKQMNAAREQLYGQLAMTEENNGTFMMMMARSMLDRGKVLAIEDTYAMIRETTPHALMELANDIFDEPQFSILRMEPN